MRGRVRLGEGGGGKRKGNGLASREDGQNKGERWGGEEKDGDRVIWRKRAREMDGGSGEERRGEVGGRGRGGEM